MNLPAAVVAAMALCNQHVVASKGAPEQYGFISASSYNGFGTTCTNSIVAYNCTEETAAQKKAREDAAMQGMFDDSYAWEPAYQAKCKTIADYLTRFQAYLDKRQSDKDAIVAAKAKAAEQPTLDHGIAALSEIKDMKQ